jgi:hypothetical protein
MPSGDQTGRSKVSSEERLLLDTGRVPLWLRVPILVAGVLFLWLSAHLVSAHLFGYDLGLHATSETGSWVLGAIVFLLFGLFFVSIWFLRNRIVLNSPGREILMRHSGLFGSAQRRISLIGATAVYVHEARLLASHFWDIGLKFGDGRSEWLIRVYGGAEIVVKEFSDATGLPISRV